MSTQRKEFSIYLCKYMKHFTENNQYEKSISDEMLDFCPLCVAEVYALRCDAMRAGTSRCPLHRPSTTY